MVYSILCTAELKENCIFCFIPFVQSNGADILSINKQKKIEELEAQLHEAEDIVKELREELREVEAELERVKTTQSQAELREQLVSVSNAKILSSDRTHNESNNCSKEDSCKGHCYFPNPDFASIIRRCKEPKLHRNGCTQRIRAFEGNSCKEVREETWRRGKEGGDHFCGAMEPSYSNGSKIVRTGNSIVHFEAAQSIRRKRRQMTRCRKGKAVSLVNLLNHAEETTHNPSCSNNSEDEDKTSVKLNSVSMEQSCDKDKGFLESQSNQAFGNPLEKGSADRIDSSMNLQDHTKGNQNPCCSKDLLDEDKAFDQSEIANVEQLSLKDKGLLEPHVKRDTDETDNALGSAHETADCDKLEGSSLTLDFKGLRQDDGVPSQSPDSKFLKYTFQRKRKREVSCSPDPNNSIDENNAKENTVEIEKHNGSLKPKSLNFTTESSPDSRRLVQVARQVSECTHSCV